MLTSYYLRKSVFRMPQRHKGHPIKSPICLPLEVNPLSEEVFVEKTAFLLHISECMLSILAISSTLFFVLAFRLSHEVRKFLVPT